MDPIRQAATSRLRISRIQIVVALAAIAVADLLGWRLRPAEGYWGVLDESAHAATGVIVLAALSVALQVRVVVAALAGSLLIDLDHLPGIVGSNALTAAGAPRPFPHTFLTVLAITAVALLARSRARASLLVAAFALTFHFFRDLAEPGGPGVRLLWPLSDQIFTVPYPVYAAVLLGCAAIAVLRRSGRSSKLHAFEVAAADVTNRP